MYLNFSTCCSLLPLTCSVHWLGFVVRHNTAMFLVLNIIPARSHATENRSSACWTHFPENASSSKSSAICRHLWYTPKRSVVRDTPKWSVVLWPGWNSHRVSRNFGSNISQHLFSRHSAYTISREAKERNATVVIPFSSATLLVYGDDHPSLSIFRCPSRTPGHLTHVTQRKNSYVQVFEQPAAFPAFSVLTAGRTSVAVMVVFSP